MNVDTVVVDEVQATGHGHLPARLAKDVLLRTGKQPVPFIRDVLTYLDGGL